MSHHDSAPMYKSRFIKAGFAVTAPLISTPKITNITLLWLYEQMLQNLVENLPEEWRLTTQMRIWNRMLEKHIWVWWSGVSKHLAIWCIWKCETCIMCVYSPTIFMSLLNLFYWVFVCPPPPLSLHRVFLALLDLWDLLDLLDCLYIFRKKIIIQHHPIQTYCILDTYAYICIHIWMFVCVCVMQGPPGPKGAKGSSVSFLSQLYII